MRGLPDKSYESHRMAIRLSDKDWSDFPGQVVDAISFLESHAQELRDIIQAHDATYAYLDFPLYSLLDGEIINQNEHLPRELVVICGHLGLGIEIAIYSKQAFDELGD